MLVTLAAIIFIYVVLSVPVRIPECPKHECLLHSHPLVIRTRGMFLFSCIIASLSLSNLVCPAPNMSAATPPLQGHSRTMTSYLGLLPRTIILCPMVRICFVSLRDDEYSKSLLQRIFLYKAGVAAIFGPGTSVAYSAYTVMQLLMNE